MAKCEACERLKVNAPNFWVNRMTDAECASLKNDTGLNPSLTPLQNNCGALQDLTDCLIGMPHDVLPAWDLCDIKDWLAGLTSNLHELMTAMVCDTCGQWDMLHNLNNRVTNIENRLANNERILSAILNQMRQVGAWSATGTIPTTTPVNLLGLPSATVNLAAGNINLFGNQASTRFIRTNQTANNPQDIRGGLT